MFGLKHAGNGTVRDSLVYFDVRVDSPYKDLVLINGSPLESNPVPMSGRVLFSLSQDMLVKRVTLKLIGKFKLDFLHMGRDKKRSGVTSIVKDHKTIFETRWDNLLVSSQGNTVIGNDNNYVAEEGRRELAKRSLSSPVVSRLIKKTPNHVLELPRNGVTGTPYTDLYSDPSYAFHLPKGNYELPFQIVLPSEIPETIEGLQSGSILYSFEARIERKRKSSSMTSLLKEDLDALHQNHGPLTTYKYLRIFRTLSANDMAIQQEIRIGGTCKDKMQYEVSIPSKAIAIGSTTPIQIKLFPFQKGYVLKRINASLLQFFAVRDSASQIYDDQITTTKQSMTEFTEFIDNQEGLLTDVTEISPIFTIPDNLKKITQDCDLRGGLIQVRHRIAITIILHSKTTNKSLEIKAAIPVLLYISPLVVMKGRLVLFDNSNGNIHFRSGELVPLFNTTGLATPAVSDPATPAVAAEAGLSAPPNYQERVKDHLVNDENAQHDVQDRHLEGLPTAARSAPILQSDVGGMAASTEAPSYEQSSWQVNDEPPPIWN
ncbi:hypothetical protein HG537_0E01360 [Torulaspora globosa]|uniref:Arrestin C-terminal-like domain-containing protein n=1 Tax=Torulaspora globosa TaxID=48254 RepID=A0A7H9HTW3_9SACH|nr:hypothetical protein HG537_0E01360 [Torulaspora sp. CBS 2947]